MDIYNLILMIVIVGIVASIISLTVVGENQEVAKILQIILLILIIILIFYIIYSVYEYYHRIIINEPMLLPGIHPANRLGVVRKKLPISLIGDEYTYSAWIYINNWNYGKPVPILQTDSGNPSIWLYPNSNNLMIRFQLLDGFNKPVFNYCQNTLPNQTNHSNSHHTDTTVDDCLNILGNNQNSKFNSVLIDKKAGSCKLIQNSCCQNQKSNCKKDNNQQYDIYQTQKTNKFDPSMVDPKRLSTNHVCDISGIPVQRWFHLGVVFWNRTTDIYLNGKLVRSCVLPGIAKFLKGDRVTIGSGRNETGLDGKLGNIRYFNRSLNATQIYKLYSKGPLQWNIFREFEDIFPKINLKINTRYDFE